MTTRQMRAAGLTVLLFVLTISMATAQRQPRTAAVDPSAPVTALSDVRPDRVDLDAVYRIKDEGLQRSRGDGDRLVSHRRVRPTPHQLSRHSRGRGLGDEASDRMGAVERAGGETWGPFGRGWVNERIVANRDRPAAVAAPGVCRARGRQARLDPSPATPCSSSSSARTTSSSGRASWPASRPDAESSRRRGPVHAARAALHRSGAWRSRDAGRHTRPLTRRRHQPQLRRRPAPPDRPADARPATDAVLRPRGRRRGARAGHRAQRSRHRDRARVRARIATPRNRLSHRRSSSPPSTTTGSPGCSCATSRAASS